MTAEERAGLIDMLVFMTGRPESFYSGMDDNRLGEEFDRLSGADIEN